MNKPEEYGISVRLVQEGEESTYVAKISEMPDVKVYGDTFAEAYEGAIEVIATTQEIFAEKGKSFPRPEIIEDIDFSGRVTLRMSKSLHASVHAKAERDGVSLNQWIVEAIASRVDGNLIPSNSIVVAAPKINPLTGNNAISISRAEYIGHFAGTNIFMDLGSASTARHIANPQTMIPMITGHYING